MSSIITLQTHDHDDNGWYKWQMMVMFNMLILFMITKTQGKSKQDRKMTKMWMIKKIVDMAMIKVVFIMMIIKVGRNNQMVSGAWLAAEVCSPWQLVLDHHHHHGNHHHSYHHHEDHHHGDHHHHVNHHDYEDNAGMHVLRCACHDSWSQIIIISIILVIITILVIIIMGMKIITICLSLGVPAMGNSIIKSAHFKAPLSVFLTPWKA